MIVWIGTSQEPNRDRGCTSISSLKLKYKIFRDKQLSNLLNAGLGRLKRPSKGQGYCHPKLWWRDMVMVYCRIFDTGCFEHVSQNKRCAQESARRSNFLLPHRRIIMGHYIAHRHKWGFNLWQRWVMYSICVMAEVHTPCDTKPHGSEWTKEPRLVLGSRCREMTQFGCLPHWQHPK